MRNYLFFLTIVLIIHSGCSKDKIEPIALFSFRNDTINVLRMGTFDECRVNSKSKNSDSVFWDLGDGRVLKDTAFLLSYSKSGIYDLKLTAKNNDGQVSVSSKKVIVLDRVLKKIIIPAVGWDSTNKTEGWPIQASTVDIYFNYRCIPMIQ